MATTSGIREIVNATESSPTAGIITRIAAGSAGSVHVKWGSLDAWKILRATTPEIMCAAILNGCKYQLRRRWLLLNRSLSHSIEYEVITSNANKNGGSSSTPANRKISVV